MLRITITVGLVICATIATAAPPKRKSEGLLNKLLAPGPLIEGHANLEQASCLKCHETGKGVPDSKCLDCHKEIAAYLKAKSGFHGRQKKKCIQCHSDHKGRGYDDVQVNEKTFEHKLTGFSLDGKHAGLRCVQCHVEKRANKPIRPEGIRFAGRISTCKSCHEKHDVHKFQPPFVEKDCGPCHSAEKWKGDTRFNHQTDGKVKLEGKHAKIKCADCHVPKNAPPDQPSIYKWPQMAEKLCLSCHEKDDVHKTNLSPSFRTGACNTCHTIENWKVPQFDHKIAKYPLLGAHAKVSCVKCHKQPAPVPKELKNFRFTGLQQQCQSCHPTPHAKTFSAAMLKRLCTDCHGLNNWKTQVSGIFNHDTMTRFELTEKHKPLACDRCHTPKRQRALVPGEAKQVFRWPETADRKFCISCHPNIHAKQFSARTRDQACSQCHTSGTFARRLPYNHDQSWFKLRDKHAEAKCEKCHVPTLAMLATKPPKKASRFQFPATGAKDCMPCHKDPHRGGFELSCVECHNDKSWKTTPDFHKNFSLTGVHYSLACSECHKNGRRLSGLGEKCVLCHQKDDIHHATLPQCGQCHRQQFWENPEFRHSLSRFPLRGVHRTIDCLSCHPGAVYRGTPYRCIDCHLRESQAVSFPPHLMPQFQDCERCHNNFQFGR